MSRRLRISLAVWLIWAALMLLILIGETSNALPTQLLTTILGRFVPDGANEALPHRFEWSIESLYILHPRTCIPTRCDHSCWFWWRAYALKCTSPREWALQLLAHDRKILDWSASHPSCNALPRRSVAGSDTPTSTFLVVIPDQISGAMLTQLFLKGAVFAISGIGSKLLRILINRLHVRYFGADHPALTRRFAL